MAEEADRSRDILGRVYEHFLGGFAGAEAYRDDPPVDMMDKPLSALPTSP